MSMALDQTKLRKSGITSERITRTSTSWSSTEPNSQQGRMIGIRTTWLIRVVALATILQAAVSAQVRPEPVAANLCDVFRSPAVYDQKVLSVEGVLFPSFHSVFLISQSCRSTVGLDFTTQAILPPSWESLRNGKQLRKFLHRRKSASVKLIGTFEYSGNPYGPDGARFRFVISEISSVEKAGSGR